MFTSGFIFICILVKPLQLHYFLTKNLIRLKIRKLLKWWFTIAYIVPISGLIIITLQIKFR